jgi:uncharacterized protein YwqG
MRNLNSLTKSLSVPAIHVVTVHAPSRSYFGGRPHLPKGTAWPVWRGRRLGFLARLSLSEINAVRTIEWLPPTGALLFFYDIEEQPWGFDPEHRGSCAVLHVQDLDEPLSPSSEVEEGMSFGRTNVAFKEIEVLPSTERPEVVALDLSEEEINGYEELSNDPFQGLPRHQVGGLPTPVQDDGMELECQLVSHGLNCGDSAGYNDPRAKQLMPGVKDWRLLFQIDSDDDVGMQWGDSGTLYVWIREDEARIGNFGNPWLIAQSF